MILDLTRLMRAYKVWVRFIDPIYGERITVEFQASGLEGTECPRLFGVDSLRGVEAIEEGAVIV